MNPDFIPDISPEEEPEQEQGNSKTCVVIGVAIEEGIEVSIHLPRSLDDKPKARAYFIQSIKHHCDVVLNKMNEEQGIEYWKLNGEEMKHEILNA